MVDLHGYERIEQFSSIRCTYASTCIPSLPCGIATVIATGHISQCIGLHESDVILVENGIQVANGFPSFLVNERDQACP